MSTSQEPQPQTAEDPTNEKEMDAEKDDVVFVPDVPARVVPHVGQQFRSADEGYLFYNEYARQVGFSVRVGNCKRNSQKKYNWKMFVCNKEGQKDMRYQNKLKQMVGRSGERNRGDVRTGCQARMGVTLNKDGDGWSVSKFFPEHNHPLTAPRKVHLLRSHRKVSAAKKMLRQQFSEANLSTAQLRRLLEVDSGWPSSIGCLEKDLRNHVQDVRAAVSGHDAQTMIDHFESEKQTNENFYYAYETDAKDQLVRCFWADVPSRNAYGYFGDVVVFYSTFNTNKYGMWFCPFVGVNNHRQSIVFGCGVLATQQTESFEWLFDKFVDAMPAHVHPKMIITNQDNAIGAAVRQVFPNTVHQLCTWHILSKFPEKMNLAVHREHIEKLRGYIWNSESTVEFETHWAELMSHTPLGDNKWLGDMYELRERWIPAYVKGVFSAGMASSQRAESNHAFFKRYLSNECTLNDLYTRFRRALERQRHLELKADHVDVDERIVPSTPYLIELQMVARYTKAIFKLFQEELQICDRYVCTMKGSTQEARIYEVTPFDAEITPERKRLVTYDVATEFVSCSCCKFESEGIPCRHMLYWMQLEQIKALPEKYILRRWTKEAKTNLVFRITPAHFQVQGYVERNRRLAEMNCRVIDKAALTEAGTSMMERMLDDLYPILPDREIGASNEREMSVQGDTSSMLYE